MGNLDLSSLESMLSGDNLIGISEKLGIGTDEIGSVIKGALPELLTGMQKNASTEEGVASLEKALSDHSAVGISDISSFLGSADQDDGAKIIGHLLGKENFICRGCAGSSGSHRDSRRRSRIRSKTGNTARHKNKTSRKGRSVYKKQERPRRSLCNTRG